MLVSQRLGSYIDETYAIFRPGADFGVGMAIGTRMIPVRVGDVEIEVEAVPAAGTEATVGRAERAAGSALEAFSRAQDAIAEVARSTAAMIEKTGAAAQPDRVEVEFGLKFSASGGVIMAGVAGEASLKVTLSYEVPRRPAAGLPLGAPVADAVQPAQAGRAS
jgi:Trypsin-co-occurring domain 1